MARKLKLYTIHRMPGNARIGKFEGKREAERVIFGLRLLAESHGWKYTYVIRAAPKGA